MSPSLQQTVGRFFQRYVTAVNGGDHETIARSYFATYLEAAPGTVHAIPVNDAYRAALRDHDTVLKQLGFEDARAVVDSVTEFAPGHVMADVTWAMTFTVPGRGPVTSRFVITYVLRLDDAGPIILLYVSHEDEKQAMQRAGILPAAG